MTVYRILSLADWLGMYLYRWVYASLGSLASVISLIFFRRFYWFLCRNLVFLVFYGHCLENMVFGMTRLFTTTFVWVWWSLQELLPVCLKLLFYFHIWFKIYFHLYPLIFKNRKSNIYMCVGEQPHWYDI